MMKKIIILLLAAFSFYGIYAAEFTGISRELPENTLQIMQIDTFGIVADIYFIRLPDGRVIVVDTGEFKTADSTLIAALDRFGIKEIDTLILTHFHLDHVGGTFSLLNDPEIRIKKVLYTSMPYEEIPGAFSKELFRRIMYMIERKEIPLQALQPGDKLDFGCGVTALVVGAAERDSKNRDLNGHSLVFQLKYKNFTALFTGDCSMQEEPRILASGLPVKSDLLKVGHHAGANSTSTKFLDAVAPKTAIACMPKWLSNDARGKRVEKMIRARNIHFFRSWEYPDAIIFSDGNTFGVYTGNEK